MEQEWSRLLLSTNRTSPVDNDEALVWRSLTSGLSVAFDGCPEEMEAVVVAHRVHVVILPPIAHDGCGIRGMRMRTQHLLDLGGGEYIMVS